MPHSDPPWLYVGATVRFHPIIGGKHDQRLYTVRAVRFVAAWARTFAWLDGIAGPVDIRSLSAPQPGQDRYGASDHQGTP